MEGTLTLTLADITTLQADCIVNAANEELRQGGGVCGAIFAAAGADRLRRACSEYPGCPTGSAVLTPAFGLKASYIAHAVGPRWRGGSFGEADLLAGCYQAALQLAAGRGCRSIIFPLISSGIFGYPLRPAWEIAIHTIEAYQKSHPQAPMDVTIAVLDQGLLDLGNAVLKADAARQQPPHLCTADMKPGRPVAGYYLLQNPSIRTSSSGKPFLSANAGDRTGSVNMIFWDYGGPVKPTDEGKAVYLKGQISEFRGALQITLDTLRLTGPEDSVDADSLVPVAPMDADAMYDRVISLVDSIPDLHYQALAREFLRRHDQAFRQIPAAKSVHHGFLHGLLMHTGNMMRIADQLAGIYPEVVNRSLLLTGTLLHDFAKREEFTFSELGLVNGYSVKGQLLGHLVMGAQEVADIGRELQIPEEKSVLLQHMLLSHHGKPEYGAAVIPMTAESELLSMIDMLDSRMEIYRENLEETPMGQFSGRIFPLDGHRIYRHYEPQV